jgi:hypothetical protein
MPDGQPQPITVIGASGALGFGLALRLARAGAPVVIGSRDADRAQETAERARATLGGGEFSGMDNPSAAAACSVVVLSVPFASQVSTLKSIKDSLREGALVIDATVPLAAATGGRATRMLGVWQGSAGQQAAETLAGSASVVSALHTVSAASLADLEHPLEQDVLICGDSREDKLRAAEVIEQIDGLRCVDCGKLEMARVTESLTAMLIGVNVRYKAHAGIRLSGLPDELWK